MSRVKSIQSRTMSRDEWCEHHRQVRREARVAARRLEMRNRLTRAEARAAHEECMVRIGVRS